MDSRSARFGPFDLDLDTGELRRDGVRVPLRPLATRALLMLVREAGRLVSKERLQEELWGKTAVEWSMGIHQVIRQIRRALDDEHRRLVETVPRRGYRFQARLDPARAASRRKSHGAGLYAAGVATPVLLVLLFLIACVLLAP